MSFVVKFPFTVIDDTSGGGTVSWSNPAAAEVADSFGAIADVGNGLTTHRLTATGFGFSLGANTVILGIEVLINAKTTSTGTIAVKEFDVKLMKAGVPLGNNEAVFVYNNTPGSFTIYLHGTTTDLWGTTWTPSDVNDPNFGFYIQLRNPATATQTDTVEVDYLEAGVIYITIYSETGSGGAELGGASLVSISEEVFGGGVVGGTALVVQNLIPTTGGMVAGGTSICQMNYFVIGADGICFLPQSVPSLSGWTGSIASIQEGVNNEDGDASYIRGASPTADYLDVNFGNLPGLNGPRRISLRVSASSESSGGSLIMGLYIGPANVGSITVSPPTGTYATFEFDSPVSTILSNFPLVGYFFPVVGPAIRITAADILVTSTAIGGTSPSVAGVLVDGGIVAGGQSNITGLTLAQGGAIAGGISDVSATYSLAAVGGVVCNGLSIAHNFIPCLGGIEIDGAWGVYSGILVAGGIEISGVSGQTLIDFVDAFGGVECGGNAIKADLHVFFTGTSGGVFVSGSDDAGIKDRHYIPTGKVSLAGSAATRIEFNVDLKLMWNVRAAIFKDLNLIWNVGQLPIFWFRVIGKGHDGNQCNLVADPCCQKYIVNIHARTPAELCQKLSGLNLNMPIDSVQKFTRPAETAVVAADAAKGISHDCNQLVQVDICQIPSCADLCIDYDVLMTFGFNIPVVQANAFFNYEGGGSVFVSGIAGARKVKNLPSFHFEASGGVETNGTSDILASFINSRGGSELGGSAHLQSNRWTYEGGVWPYTVAGLGQTAESSPSSDEPWINPALALVYDGVETFSDVSFGKQSQYLVVKGFPAGVAADDNVLSVLIALKCQATNVMVQDTEVYLVNSTGVISDNLALLADWSVGVDSFIYYSVFNDWQPILSPAMVNDPEFGVAIRVRNFNNLAIALAKVDGVSVRVGYENSVAQRVRVGGTAFVLSTAMSYEAGGDVNVEGATASYSIRRYFSEQAIGGVLLGGNFVELTTHNVVSSGGSALGLGAKVTPYIEVGSGGVVVGGTALVKPYFEFGLGGITVGGLSNVRTIFRSSAKGGLIAGGNVYNVFFHYPATGSVSLSGSSYIRSSVWSYQASGSVAVSGSAFVQGSYLGTFMEMGGFESTISEFVVNYPQDQNVPVAAILSQNVEQCECLEIPLTVNFTQNLATNNKLSQFLFRNNFVLPAILKLAFNLSNNSWQSNLHYKGVSVDGSGPENWDLLFELQCTKLAGGIDIGRTIWKLAIDINRRVSSTFNTRLIVGVLPSTICGTLSRELIFGVSFDTQANTAVVDPSSTIYQAILFDSIGLFRNKYWVDNPDLVLKVSQAALDSPQTRLNLTSQVLVN